MDLYSDSVMSSTLYRAKQFSQKKKCLIQDILAFLYKVLDNAQSYTVYTVLSLSMCINDRAIQTASFLNCDGSLTSSYARCFTSSCAITVMCECPNRNPRVQFVVRNPCLQVLVPQVFSAISITKVPEAEGTNVAGQLHSVLALVTYIATKVCILHSHQTCWLYIFELVTHFQLVAILALCAPLAYLQAEPSFFPKSVVGTDPRNAPDLKRSQVLTC